MLLRTAAIGAGLRGPPSPERAVKKDVDLCLSVFGFHLLVQGLSDRRLADSQIRRHKESSTTVLYLVHSARVRAAYFSLPS